MDVLALIIAVVLIIYLMQVGFPHPTRQRSPSRTFIRFYVSRIFSSWFLLSIAGIILLHDGTPLSSIGLLLPDPWWSTLLAFIVVGILFSVVLTIHLHTPKDEQFAAQARRLALPRTPSERLGWVAVSINAGIWEEIMFRGFIPWYLVHHVTFFGLSIPFVLAAFFALILFGLGHLYQGWGGALGVGFIGITMALFYALTGNLFASMLWHILFDVRFAFGTPTIEEVRQPQADKMKGPTKSLLPPPLRRSSPRQKQTQRVQPTQRVPYYARRLPPYLNTRTGRRQQRGPLQK